MAMIASTAVTVAGARDVSRLEHTATTTPHHLDVTVPRQRGLLRLPPLSASDDDDDERGLGINGSIGT